MPEKEHETSTNTNLDTYRERLEQALKALSQDVEERFEHSRRELSELLAGLGDRLPDVPEPEQAAAPLPDISEPSAPDSASFGELRDAIAALDEADEQAELLARLVEQASGFASRAVLLLKKDDGGLRSWASLGFSGAGSTLEGLELPTPTEPAFQAASQACQDLAAEQARWFCEFIDTELPLRGAIVPVAVRDRIPALLYADQTSANDRFSIEALQMLAHATGQSLDLLPLGQVDASPALRLESGADAQLPEAPAASDEQAGDEAEDGTTGAAEIAAAGAAEIAAAGAAEIAAAGAAAAAAAAVTADALRADMTEARDELPSTELPSAEPPPVEPPADAPEAPPQATPSPAFDTGEQAAPVELGSEAVDTPESSGQPQPAPVAPPDLSPEVPEATGVTGEAAPAVALTTGEGATAEHLPFDDAIPTTPLPTVPAEEPVAAPPAAEEPAPEAATVNIAPVLSPAEREAGFVVEEIPAPHLVDAVAVAEPEPVAQPTPPAAPPVPAPPEPASPEPPAETLAATAPQSVISDPVAAPQPQRVRPLPHPLCHLPRRNRARQHLLSQLHHHLPWVQRPLPFRPPRSSFQDSSPLRALHNLRMPCRALAWWFPARHRRG